MRFIPLLMQALGVCAALLLCSCRSYGPRFDVREPVDSSSAGQQLHEERLKLAPLEEKLFLTIDDTNRVPAEWLQPSTNYFQLGPGDVIEVETLGEAGSSASATVGPDGKIYYSFLPGAFVWGLTLSETKTLLENEMAKFLRVKPEMAVTLRAVGSKRMWLLGQVQSPGVYPLGAPVTLLEAIATAGGPASDPTMASGMPNLDYSFLLRTGAFVRIDYVKLLRHGDLSQNIYLQPDDFIYLRSGLLRNVYLLGAVGAPAALPYGDQMSLGSAIATVGGLLEYAHKSQVAVVRGSLSNPRVAIVDYGEIRKGKAPDVLLQPGDIVYVPFVPYKKLAVFAEQILRQFVSSIAANEGYRAVYPNYGGVIPTVPVGVNYTPVR